MSYCLNSETKNHLVEAVDVLHIVKQKRDELVSFINEMEVCSTDDIQKGKKNKRPLSKYNIHLSKCMKGTETGIKKQMKECIEEWREIKKNNS